MPKRKSSSNVVTSHAQTLALKDANRKRKAKKWSKGKASQAQKELDGQVDAVYSVHAVQPSQELAIPPKNIQDNAASMQTLEHTLRDL